MIVVAVQITGRTQREESGKENEVVVVTEPVTDADEVKVVTNRKVLESVVIVVIGAVDSVVIVVIATLDIAVEVVRGTVDIAVRVVRGILDIAVGAVRGDRKRTNGQVPRKNDAIGVEVRRRTNARKKSGVEVEVEREKGRKRNTEVVRSHGTMKKTAVEVKTGKAPVVDSFCSSAVLH